MVKDPEFIAAAQKEKLEVRPQSGDKIAEIIFGLLDTPADVRERMKVVLQPKDLRHVIEQPAGQEIASDRKRKGVTMFRFQSRRWPDALILGRERRPLADPSPISTRASRSASSCARRSAATTINTRG